MTATSIQNSSAAGGVSTRMDSTTTAAAPSATAPTAARAGAMAMLPLLAAYIPFALVVGSAVGAHGSPLAAWTGSWLIYGGSAHVATLRTLDDAGAVAAILTGLLINARLLVYSASLARRWGGQPRWFRIVAAGMIIDPTWAAAERHADQCSDLRRQRQYFLASGLTLGAGWSAAIGVGAVMGARLDGLDLEIVIPLCLLGLIGPGLRAAGARSVIVVAAVAALVTTSWPAGTGILFAVVAGCGAGLSSDRRSRS
ncbi:MAG: AzlC family ABC transporter permease [Acidimicrobiales bacterium]